MVIKKRKLSTRGLNDVFEDSSFKDSEFGEELDEELFDTNKTDDLEDFDDDDFDDLETSFDNNARIQQIWLDADPYINNLFLSLSNKEIKKKRVMKEGEEEIKTYVRQIPGTEPLANQIGLSQIMGLIRGIFSKDIVMGNVDRKQYDDFMYDWSLELWRILIINRIDWGITISNVNLIHTIILNGCHFYLTRPISDGERRSSRGRNDAKDDDRPRSFMDRIVGRYKTNQGRT